MVGEALAKIMRAAASLSWVVYLLFVNYCPASLPRLRSLVASPGVAKPVAVGVLQATSKDRFYI